MLAKKSDKATRQAKWLSVSGREYFLVGLGGGFKCFFYFHPDIRGSPRHSGKGFNVTMQYFSKGSVQPPRNLVSGCLSFWKGFITIR